MGKWANQIDMNMSETAAGNFNLLWLQVNMFVHLAALVMEACPGKGGNLFAEVRPAEPGGNQLTRCSDSWVGDVMERTKSGSAECGGKSGRNSPVETSPSN